MDSKNNENEQWILLVLHLKKTAEEKGITHQQIADASGLIKSNVTRFFSVKYKPNLDTFLKVAKAVGVTIKAENI